VCIRHVHTLALGTFITEWNDGARVCERVLQNEHTVDDLVQKLCCIADTYNFDGWLINIENGVDVHRSVSRALFGAHLTCVCSIPLLLQFVSVLRERSRQVLGENSCIVWYDSVICTSGRLKWQDELNALNRCVN
jgi:mannosyl-glycoprotein endo-beta-N-acetylglucosaminidase